MTTKHLVNKTNSKSVRKFRSLTLLLFVLLTYSCEPPGDHRLKYINKSGKYLLLDWGFNDSMPIEFPFKDMRETYKDSISKTNADILNYYKLIKPYQTKTISTGTGTWDSFFLNSSDKKLTVFLFEFQTVSKVKWDSIRSNDMYYAKYTLTLDSLEAKGWILNH